MEYRSTTAEEDGFDDEQEESVAMRDYVISLMAHTDPNDMMDTLLIMANVCETRAMMTRAYNPAIANWYRTAAQAMRACLTLLCRDAGSPKPNEKLEDPLLYFPDQQIKH